ncbi:10589_t:CDS:1, partial [Gigaspora margarita]
MGVDMFDKKVRKEYMPNALKIMKVPQNFKEVERKLNSHVGFTEEKNV